MEQTIKNERIEQVIGAYNTRFEYRGERLDAEPSFASYDGTEILTRNRVLDTRDIEFMTKHGFKIDSISYLEGEKYFLATWKRM